MTTQLDPRTGKETRFRFECALCRNLGRTSVPVDPKERQAVYHEGRALAPMETLHGHGGSFRAPCVNPDCAFGMTNLGEIPPERLDRVRGVLSAHYGRQLRRPVDAETLAKIMRPVRFDDEGLRRALAEWLATSKRRQTAFLLEVHGADPVPEIPALVFEHQQIDPTSRGRRMAGGQERAEWWQEQREEGSP